MISFMDSSLRLIDPFALCGHPHRYIPQGSKIKYGTLLRKTHCSVACKPASTLLPGEIGLGAIEKDEDNESDKTPSLSIFLPFYSPTDSAALEQYIFEYQFIVLYRLFSM